MPVQSLSAEQALSNLVGLDAKLRNMSKSSTAVNGLEVTRQDLEDDLKLAANVDTPVRNRLNRIKGEGKAHAFYQLVSNFDPSGKNKFLGTDPSNGVFAKGGLPNAKDAQYTYVARPYSNVGDIVTVPWQDKAQDESYIDIKAQQKRVKMINTGLMEEYLIINGDSDATNGLAFDGFIPQIQKGGYNVLDLSAGGGSPLRLALISQELFRIKLAGGQTRFMLMSYAMKQAITQLIQYSFYGIRGSTGQSSAGPSAGGIQVDAWNFGTGDVELLADQYMNVDPITGYERILFIDDMTQDDKNSGNVVQMVDVDPLHYQDLATIATADRGIVYETTQLMIGILQYQGMIEGFNLQLPATQN